MAAGTAANHGIWDARSDSTNPPNVSTTNPNFHQLATMSSCELVVLPLGHLVSGRAQGTRWLSVSVALRKTSSGRCEGHQPRFISFEQSLKSACQGMAIWREKCPAINGVSS